MRSGTASSGTSRPTGAGLAWRSLSKNSELQIRLIALVHGTGCGMASKGEGFETFMRTEWGYAANPNVGATLMIGLGCEVFQISRMKDEFGVVEGDGGSDLNHARYVTVGRRRGKRCVTPATAPSRWPAPAVGFCLTTWITAN